MPRESSVDKTVNVSVNDAGMKTLTASTDKAKTTLSELDDQMHQTTAAAPTMQDALSARQSVQPSIVTGKQIGRAHV